MSWLFDTLGWTGALIALVLMTRRAVARHFGPKAAYALWALPLMRLVLPPIVLPAWLGPATVPVDETTLVVALPAGVPAAAEAAPAIDWLSLVVTLWAAGALIYIAMRLSSYFQLRRELLAQARCVGAAGTVRLVETPATASPLAFGVLDKVIALPPGFMAAPDRLARDLALSHELAHHGAHDLAVNFLALPLFALHWFNPLSLFGWTAMRRDQEAACDARVIEHRDRQDRAAYALLIANAVAGPRGALAAPMACPVLGDKSIVHRLRNLTMTTPSTRQRRVGALLVCASMLLVPLTASISYAQDDSIEAPLPPAPPLAPVAPRAPVAPVSVVEPTPSAPRVIADGDGTYVIEHAAPGEGEHRVFVVRSGKDGKDRKREIRRTYRIERVGKDGKFDEKAFERQMETLNERLSHLDADLQRRVMINHRDMDRTMREAIRVERLAPAIAARAAATAPRVVMDCSGENGVSDSTTADGHRVVRICERRISANTLGALRTARDRIASKAELSEGTRQEVLRSLDSEIERLEREAE